MMGYGGRAEDTPRTIDEERWLHTGDLATMGEDGYIHITGRLEG